MRKKTLAAWLAASCLCLPGPSFAQRTPLAPLPRDELQTMANVFGMLQSDSVKPTDGPALIIAAVRGMLREADPEAGEYLDAKAFAELRSGRPESAALSGLHLVRRDGRVLLQPLTGGPAQEAGVQFDDVLYAVDGARIANLDTRQIAALLQGPQGSTFSITVFRESTLSVLTLTVQRRPLTGVAPRMEAIAPGIALLRVPHYRNDTLEETARLLKDTWRREPFRRGLVLDLRGSPGGLLSAAVGVASIFLPDDAPVAYTQGQTPESNAHYKAGAPFYTRAGESDPLAGLPPELRAVKMVVLTDHGTAAGAEIVAAALKDNHRATLVGQKTWGRGSIQTIRPLSHSDGVKLTTAYWFSPNGARIHGVGVAPDVPVADPSPDAAVRAAVAALGPGG